MPGLSLTSEQADLILSVIDRYNQSNLGLLDQRQVDALEEAVKKLRDIAPPF